MHVELSDGWKRHFHCELNPKSGRRFPILIEAVSLERHRQLRLLLEAGVNVNCREKQSGFTPLIQAMFIENTKQRLVIVKTLLSYGGEVVIADKEGRTAFSWACRLARNDIIQYFFTRMINSAINSVDTFGNDNLILACMSGNPTTVRLVAEAFRRGRFDLNRSNRHNKTALMTAHEMGYYGCVKVLVENGYVHTSLPKDVLYGQRQSSSRLEIKSSKRSSYTSLPLIFSVYSDHLTNSFRQTMR